MVADEIWVERKTKQKNKNRKRGRGRAFAKSVMDLNIRPMITRLEVLSEQEEQYEIAFETCIVEKRMAKPKDILTLLELNPDTTRVIKRNILLREEVPELVGQEM